MEVLKENVYAVLVKRTLKIHKESKTNCVFLNYENLGKNRPFFKRLNIDIKEKVYICAQLKECLQKREECI